MVGGRGDDVLRGGAGADVIFATSAVGQGVFPFAGGGLRDQGAQVDREKSSVSLRRARRGRTDRGPRAAMSGSRPIAPRLRTDYGGGSGTRRLGQGGPHPG